MACVYKIENKINGKLYIGSTCKSFNKRRGEHLCSLIKNYHFNKHLQSAWNKYGENNFEFIIIESFKFPKSYDDNIIQEYVLSREMYCINLLNPEYNITREIRAGKLGRVLSEDERLQISKRTKGRRLRPETIIKIKKARAKQVITEEHKRKIGLKSKGNKYCLGRKLSDEHKQKIRKSTQYLADNQLGLHSEEAKAKRTATLKVKFNTPEMKEVLKKSARSRSKKPFLCFKDGELIGEFLSQADTADILNLKSSEICAVLRGEQNTTRGYTFKYKNHGELDRY